MSGYALDGERAEFIGNLVQGNKTLTIPGFGTSPTGIYLADAGTPLIKNNIITGNYSNDSALRLIGDIAPLVIQNMIYGNQLDQSQVIAPAGASAVIVVPNGKSFRNYPSIIASNTIADNTYVVIPSIGQYGNQLSNQRLV